MASVIGGAIAALLVITGWLLPELRSGAIVGCGAADCLGTVSPGWKGQLWELVTGAEPIVMNSLPVLGGLFLGAPLVATQLERGIHLYVWTQDVSRRTWLTARLLTVLVPIGMGTAALGCLAGWWVNRGSWDGDRYFQTIGVIPAAATLSAISIAAGLGIAAARARAAMLLFLVAFAPIRVLVPWLSTQVLVPPSTVAGVRVPAGGIVLSREYLGSPGAPAVIRTTFRTLSQVTTLNIVESAAYGAIALLALAIGARLVQTVETAS